MESFKAEIKSEIVSLYKNEPEIKGEKFYIQVNREKDILIRSEKIHAALVNNGRVYTTKCFNRKLSLNGNGQTLRAEDLFIGDESIITCKICKKSK